MLEQRQRQRQIKTKADLDTDRRSLRYKIRPNVICLCPLYRATHTGYFSTSYSDIQQHSLWVFNGDEIGHVFILKITDDVAVDPTL